MDHEFVWLSQGEKGSERDQQTIKSKKFMLMTVCNPQGFHFTNFLDNGAESTSQII
jgi:hypothetical protein